MTTTLKGFSFPFQIDKTTGGVRSQSGDDKLRANIVHILLTNVGERVMRRSYCGGLRALVQEPNNNALFAISVACACTMIFIVPRRDVVVSEELIEQAEEDEQGMM